MRQTTKVTVLVFASLFAAGQFQFAAQTADPPQPEPVVTDEDKLSYWLLRLCNSHTADRAETLRRIHEHQDFVRLKQELPDLPGPERRQFAATLERIRKELRPHIAHVIKLLDVSDLQIRSVSMTVLSIMGAEAHRAIPILLKQFQLNPMVEDVDLPELFSTLYSITPRDRSVTAEMWKTYQQLPEAKIAALRKSADRQTENADQFCFSVEFAGTLLCRKLAETDRVTAELLPLAAVAKSKSAPAIARCTILFAIHSLHRLPLDKPVTKGIAEEIRPITQDENPLVQTFARLALISLESNKRSAAKLLDSFNLSTEEKARLQEYVDQLFQERSELVDSLKKVFNPPPEEEEIWVKFREFYLDQITDDSNLYTQRTFINLMGAIGKDAQPAVPRLLEALKSSDELVCEAARSALMKIDPEAIEKANHKPGK